MIDISRTIKGLKKYTIARMILICGALFGITSAKPIGQIPNIVFWGIAALLFVIFVRCWAGYLIVRRCARYVMIIEREFYGTRRNITGYENYHRGHWLSSNAFLIVNFFCWIMILGISVYVALSRTMGWPIW